MIIEFTGTRKGMTQIQKTMVKSLIKKTKGTEFHHGDCVGSDADFHNIVNSLGNVIKHPCNLDNQRAHTTGGDELEIKAPLDRNRDIVNVSDIMIACPGGLSEEQRSGTWATIRYAKKIGKKIYIVWPNGRVDS